jgi:hypothetical protein
VVSGGEAWRSSWMEQVAAEEQEAEAEEEEEQGLTCSSLRACHLSARGSSRRPHRRDTWRRGAGSTCTPWRSASTRARQIQLCEVGERASGERRASGVERAPAKSKRYELCCAPRSGPVGAHHVVRSAGRVRRRQRIRQRILVRARPVIVGARIGKLERHPLAVRQLPPERLRTARAARDSHRSSGAQQRPAAGAGHGCLSQPPPRRLARGARARVCLVSSALDDDLPRCGATERRPARYLRRRPSRGHRRRPRPTPRPGRSQRCAAL